MHSQILLGEAYMRIQVRFEIIPGLRKFYEKQLLVKQSAGQKLCPGIVTCGMSLGDRASSAGRPQCCF